MLNGKIHLSTIVLVTIAIFDLVTTLMLLNQGFGESNPLFGRLAEMGTAPFVLGKLVFLVGPILLLEYVRTKHPQSAEQGTWIAAFFYAFLYIVHLVRHLG